METIERSSSVLAMEPFRRVAFPFSRKYQAQEVTRMRREQRVGEVQCLMVSQMQIPRP